ARAAVWEHVERLRGELGTTLFLTTHSMEEADSLCSRLAILHRGKLAATGTPADLKASLGRPAGNAVTLDDVFLHYAGDSLGAALPEGGSFRAASRERRTARRMG
ncbi:MAG TPA: ABC transporter ATP-binding protein, partial [Thermoanaerobaculia bacterium]|nr:ABC transporter ATP-binding protein [Thermoanaerobaculia bacterium]